MYIATLGQSHRDTASTPSSKDNSKNHKKSLFYRGKKKNSISLNFELSSSLLSFQANFAGFISRLLLLDSFDGGETRDRADIYTSNTKSVNTRDSDTVGAEVTETTIKGSKIFKCMDTNLVHITKVSESNRNPNEESARQHEGLLGGGWSPH